MEKKYYAKFTWVMVQVGDEPDEHIDYGVAKARSRGLADLIARLLNAAQGKDLDLDALTVG